MTKEIEVLNKFGYDITLDEFEALKKNHPYIGEKIILDLVNGVGVVAKDLNDSAKLKEKGIDRLTDNLLGNAKKRQNQINENLIEGLKSASLWLQDHSRHLSRIDMRIRDVADELYNTQDEIFKFYKEFKDMKSIIEDFKRVADNRFSEIEYRLTKVEAQQHIDREVEKIGKLNIPLSVEIFTILDNLVSGEFGWYYFSEEDIDKREEFLEYIKNKIKSKIGNKLFNFIDYKEMYQKMKKLPPIEQKAIEFIGTQYSNFSDNNLYEISDTIKIISTSNSSEEVEIEIAKHSHITTFMTIDNFVDEATNELMNI